jgi:hypothetical protein
VQLEAVAHAPEVAGVLEAELPPPPPHAVIMLINKPVMQIRKTIRFFIKFAFNF